MRGTNTPVNEHLRICRDHFKAKCFTKKPGSSSASVKPGSSPTKFCFVQEKEPKKPPKNRKPVEKQQKISDVFTEAAYAELAENGLENNDIELDMKEPIAMIVYMFKIASDLSITNFSCNKVVHRIRKREFR